MNLEEFKKRLLTDPYADDPEVEAARNSSLEHARAARESAEFERRLRAALETPVAPDAAGRVLDRVLGETGSTAGGGWRWLAMAASLVAAVEIAVLLVREPPAHDLRVAFVEHLNHPEPMALAADEPVPPALVVEALALVGADDRDPSQATVTYVSRCVIDGVRGVHMVLTDAAARKTTLLFVPDRRVAESQTFAAGDRPARMFDTPTGAVAVFGHGGQSPDPVIRDLFSSQQDLLAFRS